MERSYKKIPIGDQIRYRVVIKDIPSSGAEIRRRQYEFLQDLINNGHPSGLMDCGPMAFQTFKMEHDGDQWVIVMEAYEDLV